MKISGVYYNSNDGAEKYDYFVRKHDIGLIAQEVEEVLPEIVSTRANGFKAIKYERVVALLVECIKDLQKQVDELKEK